MSKQKESIKAPKSNDYMLEQQKRQTRKAMRQLRDLKKGKRNLWDSVEA
jgi:hypothetical protein